VANLAAEGSQVDDASGCPAEGGGEERQAFEKFNKQTFIDFIIISANDLIPRNEG